MSYTGITAAMGFDTFIRQKIAFEYWNHAATKSFELQWQLLFDNSMGEPESLQVAWG